jgi:glycosyltransferase involved in cell wall biosynthesis
MKIGIDAREFVAGRITGIGRFLWHFLQQATTSKNQHEYVLFCNQKTHIPHDLPRLKKVIITENIRQVWDQILLPLNIAREKIDVFLTPYFKAPLFLSSKMVLIINDLIPLFFPEEHRLFKRLYFRFMSAATARRATRIMTISEHSRGDIARFLRLPADKIMVIHLGVEERFKSSYIKKEEIRRKYSLPQKFILYVGNLSPHKNVRGLIKSYASLPVSLRDNYPLVLGALRSDKYFSEINKVIREMELIQNVFFTDYIEHKDLPSVYRISSVFAFPSFYEGFGLPPLEAMACGCPVVSSNTSSMPEVLGDAALFFNPYHIEEMSQAIRLMLEDENLRKGFSQKGLERAKLFTIEKMTSGMLDILEMAHLKIDGKY